MGYELLAVGIWSGIVSMDTTAAMQIMISRPLVSCLVTGAILGDYQLGLLIGIYLELIWINELPVGAAYFAESNVGSVAATSIAIIAFQTSYRLAPSIALALVCAIAISLFSGTLVEMMRSMNARTFEKLLSESTLTFHKVEMAHYKGIFTAFLLGFLVTTLSAIVLGKLLFPFLISYIPRIVDRFLEPVGIAFLGAGSGVLIYMFARNKKFWWMVFIGISLGLLFICK